MSTIGTYGEIADGIKIAVEKQRENEQLGRLANALKARAIEHGCNYSIQHTDADRLAIVEIRFWPIGMQSNAYAPVKTTGPTLAHTIDKVIDLIDHHDWAAEAQR